MKRNGKIHLADIVRRAADLINEKGWVSGRYASTAQGHCIPIHSRHAERFCLSGALIRADARKWEVIAHEFRRFYGENMSHFNDSPGRTRQEVLVRAEEFASRLEAGA